MFYPHADDENVSMGYANYNHKEENTMVTIRENAFKTYMFANYLSKLDQPALLEILESQIDTETLIDMAQSVWSLPFDLSEGKVNLVDAEALLLRHSEPEECYECPDMSSAWEDEEDYEIVSYDDDDQYAPYDELDEDLEENEDEKA